MRVLAIRDSIPASAPFHARLCVEEEAPLAGVEGAGTHRGIVGYTSGLAPEPRPLLPGYDDGITAIVTAVFVLLAVSVSRHTSFIRTFASALTSGRRRDNTFDDHTVDETRITVALLLVCCVCEGILLYFAASMAGWEMAPFPAVAIGSAVAVALMCAQTAAYSVTGYAFATHSGDTSRWVRGFLASQALLGLALSFPALAVIFYPGSAPVAVATGAGLYCLARLFFICKGFRFFYTNLFSLVYFILYLCTLEIAPLLFLWRMSIPISGLTH